MSMHLPAIERARRYLATLPPAVAGQRGHDATFRAACAMIHGFALGEDTAFALLSAEFNPRCCPPWSPVELGHKIRSAAAAISVKPRGYMLGELINTPLASLSFDASRWPKADAPRRAAILAAGPDAVELCESSLVSYDGGDGGIVEEILRQLFSTANVPDPLLCIGRSSSEFATRPLSAWIRSDKLSECALIVPSPMSARTGRTKNGHMSEHSLENTGPRRFIVVEFDEGTTDDHAALLWHLAGYGPLTLVVHSGGKSLHGWFYADSQPEDNMLRFTRYAASLGADAALFRNLSQFVRLPGGQRENGARQNVFYFNPTSLGGAANE